MTTSPAHALAGPRPGGTPGNGLAADTIIEARDIKKRFGDHTVLKGVSLEARRGDVIALIGSSGSGKSTLLRCLNLLETPYSGTIRFRGAPVDFDRAESRSGRKQIEHLRARVGMVFQKFNLWEHRTVLENVMEGPRYVLGLSKQQAAEIARGHLSRVGLSGKEGAYPGHLSGGQQQRAAIARTLAMSPDAILFDEPTSALDPELVGEVLKVMRQLASEGCTMIIVTHEMAFARDVAGHVMFLKDGMVAAEGSPQDLFNGGGPASLRSFLSRDPER